MVAAAVDIVSLAGVPQRTGHPLPTCATAGDVASRHVIPRTSALWSAEVKLGTSASLAWSPNHRDEVLYVVDGWLDVDGRRVAPGGVAVVETGATPVASSATGARVLHFGTSTGTGQQAAGGGVHTIGPAGRWARTIPHDGAQLTSQFFTDGTCTTCRAVLLRVAANHGCRLPSHHHSLDEIIVVLAGDLRLGPAEMGPGTVITIPHGVRYGLGSTNGFTFVNYRAGVSTITTQPGEPPELETAAGRGYTAVRAER